MLKRKMLRDMGRHKTQFISIFLMAFLAVFIYAGVGAEWRGLQKSADKFYAQANLADAFLYASGFTDEQAEAVGNIPGVTAVERRLELSAAADFENAPALTLYFVEKNEISKLYLLEGAGFDREDGDGIWLDKRFADAHNVTPGDKIGLTPGGAKLTKTVRGLIYSAEQVFEYGGETLTPNFENFGYAYLSAKAFPAPGMLTYGTLLVTADSAEGLEDQISAALDGKYGVYLEQKDHPSVSMFTNETAQHKMMGDIFPVVFLLIALLTMTTTMTRIVTNQRIQIGTLKALGFKQNVILRHYISYGFFLALLGAAAGLITGPVSLPYLFYPSMSSFYTLPEWKPVYAPAFCWVSLALVLLCAAVSWLACHKLLRDTPADTLRPKAPKTFRHGLLERTRLWRRLGFNAQWNIRDASRNRVRSLMAVVGVFGCTALVVCALGMNDCMADLKVWQFETVNRYESKLTLSETATREQTGAIIAAVHGEAVMEGQAEIRAKGEKKSCALLVTDHTTLINPTDVHLRPVTLPEEGVSVTLKMADSLGVRRGDEVEWRIYGAEGWTASKITAVYRDPVDQGLTMTRAYFEELGMTFRPTAILSAERVTEHMDGVDAVTSTAGSAAGWDDLTEAMYTMVYLLILAAAVLSVVVLYNLGLLSFTEMEREMATLKVMGLKSGKLRGLLLTQNLWFSAAGFALGVPGGLWLTGVIISFSGDEFDFPITPHFITLLISFAFTFGLSVLVNLLFSRKIRGLNMVESLKATE
ncbi:MAG: ABC transporter permease [Oscillospiraceae bacterium]|jgi:putative ABC transport system permease protein|nr:ABC transporter permease [Oscillospiraceae bacterium]